MLLDELSTEERRILRDVEAVSATRRPFHELLAIWNDFVSEVESGYGLTIFNYVESLGSRDKLAALMARLPSSLASKLSRSVQAIDDRYNAATERISKPLRGGDACPEWWFRIPRALGEELRY